MIKISVLLSFAVILSSCSEDDAQPKPFEVPNATGITFASGPAPMSAPYNALNSALQQNAGISIIAELNHTQNAASVNKELPPEQIIFFGNPVLGTPMMQKNQLAGLDLPQKILFYEQKDSFFAVYNSATYLESRHGLEGVETVDKVSDALANLTENAVNSTTKKSEIQTVSKGEGVETIQSTRSFMETYSALKNTIENNENLSLVAELDHRANDILLQQNNPSV